MKTFQPNSLKRVFLSFHFNITSHRNLHIYFYKYLKNKKDKNKGGNYYWSNSNIHILFKLTLTVIVEASDRVYSMVVRTQKIHVMQYFSD